MGRALLSRRRFQATSARVLRGTVTERDTESAVRRPVWPNKAGGPPRAGWRVRSCGRRAEAETVTETTFLLNGLVLTLSFVEHRIEPVGLSLLDWLLCDVSVTALGFSGRFRWNVLSTELLDLAADLDTLRQDFPRVPGTVFKPSEPNVVLCFVVESTGYVEGRYVFQPELACSTRLAGQFSADLSCLPDLVTGLRRFVDGASEAA